MTNHACKNKGYNMDHATNQEQRSCETVVTLPMCDESIINTSTMSNNNANVVEMEFVVTIDYNDLVRFNDQYMKKDEDEEVNKYKSVNENEKHDENNDMLLRQTLLLKIEKAFGIHGLGILCVSNIPNLQEQRQNLLPLGAKLPYLEDIHTLVDSKSLYSTGWSHGKEELAPGRPDYSKGSYYANPLTENILESLLERRRQWSNHNDVDNDNHTDDEYYKKQALDHPEFYAPNLWPTSTLPELQLYFCTLGKTLVNVGLLVSRVCDVYCSEYHYYHDLNLYNTIQHSLNCKGRLLHYFASSNNKKNNETRNDDTKDNEQLWCAWHNDHGSLTGLVPALYLDENGNEVSCPDNHAGLYIQPRSSSLPSSSTTTTTCTSTTTATQQPNNVRNPVRVQIPPQYNNKNCALYQIGETSQIQSGGIFQATPHAVMMPQTNHHHNHNNNNITRESFAVFMEPEFDTPLKIPNGTTINDIIVTPSTTSSTVCVPSLHGRWKEGQTFGDFHLATVTAFTTSTN